jgi:hypothetical protein
MRSIPTYERFHLAEAKIASERGYVGVHCSPKSIAISDFYGPISEEYHSAFEQVLKAVQRDYPGARALLKKVDSFDRLSLVDDSVDLIFEVVEFFADNNLEWIFVSNSEPMTKYGANCHRVYFKNVGNVYPIEDEMTDGARIYVYNAKTDRPILRPYI